MRDVLFLFPGGVRPAAPRGGLAHSRAAPRKGLKMSAVPFPKYSPDLNPMDFFVWAEVNRRMASQSPPANESQIAFKKRLRKTALGIPASAIRAAVGKIKAKAAEVVLSKGGRIPSD